MKTIEKIALETTRFNTMQSDWILLQQETMRRFKEFATKHGQPPTHLVLNQKAKQPFYDMAETFNLYKTPRIPDPYTKEKFLGLEIVWAEVEKVQVGILGVLA